MTNIKISKTLTTYICLAARDSFVQIDHTVPGSNSCRKIAARSLLAGGHYHEHKSKMHVPVARNATTTGSARKLY